ncbi:MAG: class I SAM-dependent methyltransferase [Planctomycetaceae bacterium]
MASASTGLKGSKETWGIWERMVPSMVLEPDAAGKRMLDIHLRRYNIAATFVAGNKVLDIASGTGYGSRMLRDAGAESVLGVDLSSEAVEFAQKEYGTDGIEYRQGNAEEFSSDERFDVVATFETIEHLKDPVGYLKVLHKHLVDGGRLLLSAPIGETRHIDSYHLHVFEREDIYRLVSEAGFKIEAFRFDDWKVTTREVLSWSKIYPESKVPMRELLFTWRGRTVLKDLVFRQGIRLPMLMVSAVKSDSPCETPSEAQLQPLNPPDVG